MKTPILYTKRLILRPFEEDVKENPASQNVLKKLGFIYEKEIPYECNAGKVLREGVQCRLILR